MPIIFSFLETHIFLNGIFVYDIQGFHSSVAEDTGLMGCDAVSLGWCFWRFEGTHFPLLSTP